MMPEERPVRTLHEFISDVLEEWEKAKISAIIGIIGSLAVISITTRELLKYGPRLLKADPLDLLLIIISLLAGAFLVISHLFIYHLYKKWSIRLRKLKKTEESLLKGGV